MKRSIIAIGIISFLLFLLFVVARPARADDLTVGLVACYDLEESSGARVDAWSTHDLTDNNTVGSNTGVVGNAADFAAANTEWLGITDNSSMSLSSDSDFTIALWVYPTSVVNKRIVDKGPNSNLTELHEFQIQTLSNSYRLNVGDGTATGFVSSVDTFSINNWYFVVAWHDAVSNTVNIQVNGGAVSTAAWSNGTQDTNGSFVLGRFGDFAGGYWDGRIDQVVYWKDQLINEADRAWLYNSGAGRDCQEIADTVPTPTPSPTLTPSPTPTGTPLPTPSPTPGPKIEYVDLPGGGRGEIVHSISAGEAAIAAVGMVLIVFGAYNILSNWARAAGSK